MSIAFITIGCVGLLGATYLLPLFGALFLSRERKANSPISRKCGKLAIHIIIPSVPGSASACERTLRSLSNVRWPSNLSVTTRIAIDGRDPELRQLAERYGVVWSERDRQRGKWQTLREAVIHGAPQGNWSGSDWIGFVDVGTIIPFSFGQELFPELEDPSLSGVFPAYEVQQQNSISSLVWGVERSLKSLENSFGGTISAHGATMFFRSEAIQRAFSFFGTREFANDDVVIPLVVRLLFPHQSTKYLKNLCVTDSDVSLCDTKQRRRRLMLGNLEWIAEFLPLVLGHSTALFLVTMRRVFRTFWAYWLGFIALGVFVAQPIAALMALAAVAVGVVASRQARDLVRAFQYSLESPFRLFFMEEGIEWK
ncbi:MAG: glycosyltransferase family 2 protein [Bdellovibrionales bacterium]|nr:glycosyltransferase family 2 protein [Bdellovibrionales bacterium]